MIKTRRIYNYKDSKVMTLGFGVTQTGVEFVLFTYIDKHDEDGNGIVTNAGKTEFINNSKLIHG